MRPSMNSPHATKPGVDNPSGWGFGCIYFLSLLLPHTKTMIDVYDIVKEGPKHCDHTVVVVITVVKRTFCSSARGSILTRSGEVVVGGYQKRLRLEVPWAHRLD